MQNYRTLTLENIYAPDEITDALSLLQSCGIESIVNPSNITLNFDIVDLKMLESTTQNTLVQKTLEELYKIRSFSSQNGKIVFKSFNKAKKVANKKQNAKARLAYESYKKEFSKETNEIQSCLNQIYCEDSLEFLKKLPNNLHRYSANFATLQLWHQLQHNAGCKSLARVFQHAFCHF
ncbi:hypothetical protein HpVa146_02380 [Helicobacter pylori]